MHKRSLMYVPSILSLSLTTLGGTAPASQAAMQVTSDSVRTATGLDEPTGDLTLQQAIALAVSQNPELVSLSWETQMTEGRRIQAGLRPNPELSVEMENVGGSLPGASNAEATVSLEQTLELGGKRGARIDAAKEERRVVDLDYEILRLSVVSEVKERFAEVLATGLLTDLAHEDLQVVDAVTSAAAQRVRAGAVSPAEESRAVVELANARLQQLLLGEQYSLARRRLASLWGSAVPQFSRAVGSLDTLAQVPSINSLLQGTQDSFEMARWKAETRLRERLLAVERSKRVPDLTLGAGFRSLRETNDETFVAGLSIPLPIFHRNQGDIHTAGASVSQGRSETQRALIARQSQVVDAFTSLTQAGHKIRVIRRDVVPGATRALEQVRTGYERGRFGYLDLLEARRTWIRARTEEISGLLEYQLARAELERLLSGSAIVLELQGESAR